MEDSPAAHPVLGGAVQPAEVRPDEEASATNEASTDEDILPDLEYARGLHSICTASDETFFRHNFDIFSSVHIHFPRVDQGIRFL